MGGSNSKQDDLRQSLASHRESGVMDYQCNPSIKHGPIHQRKCTDLLFTILFIVFVAVMGYIGNSAYTNGKPD